MKLLSVILLTALTTPMVGYAEEPVFTTQDLYNHLGIRGFKWNHDVDSPFNKATVNLIQYTRNEYGNFEKTLISSQTITNSAFWGAGSHSVTAMFDKSKCSLSFLTLNMSCAESEDMIWADEEVSYCEEYPMYLDGEYIFMIKWRDNSVSTNKDDMDSYLCMTIDTSLVSAPSQLTQPTEFH